MDIQQKINNFIENFKYLDIDNGGHDCVQDHTPLAMEIWDKFAERNYDELDVACVIRTLTVFLCFNSNKDVRHTALSIAYRTIIEFNKDIGEYDNRARD